MLRVSHVCDTRVIHIQCQPVTRRTYFILYVYTLFVVYGVIGFGSIETAREKHNRDFAKTIYLCIYVCMYIYTTAFLI